MDMKRVISFFLFCCLFPASSAEVLRDYGAKSQFCINKDRISKEHLALTQSRDVFHVGEEYRLRCSCGKTCSPGDIVFQFTRDVKTDFKTIPHNSGLIHEVGSGEAELLIKNLTLKNAGTYKCCYSSCEDTEPIKAWTVRVGLPPSAPYDAYCVNDGQRVLKCNWKHNITGTHIVPQYFAYYAAQIGEVQAQGYDWRNVSDDGLVLWSSRFEMPLSHSFHRFYYVRLCATVHNLGCICGVKRIGLLESILRPAPVLLGLKTATNSSAVFSFTNNGLYDTKYRFNFTWYQPPGVKRTLTTTVFRAQIDVCSHVRMCAMKDNLTPFTNYSVVVEARPEGGSGQPERGEWGEASKPLVFTTDMDVPQAAPGVVPGMYCTMACPDSDNLCLTVHWLPISVPDQAGTNFRYRVKVRQLDPLTGEDTVLEEDETSNLQYSYTLPGDSLTSALPLTFVITGTNTVGNASESAIVKIDSKGSTKPKWVKEGTLNGTKIAVSWEGSPEANHTVFWCVRGTGSTCAPDETGVLHSVLVEAGVSSKVLELSEDIAHSFAVASVSHDGTSGMEWAHASHGRDSSRKPADPIADWSRTVMAVVIPIALVVIFLGAILAIRKGRRYWWKVRRDMREAPKPKLPAPPPSARPPEATALLRTDLDYSEKIEFSDDSSFPPVGSDTTAQHRATSSQEKDSVMSRTSGSLNSRGSSSLDRSDPGKLGGRDLRDSGMVSEDQEEQNSGVEMQLLKHDITASPPPERIIVSDYPKENACC